RFVVLIASGEREREVRQRTLMMGIEVDRLAVILHGVLPAALGIVDHAEQMEGVRGRAFPIDERATRSDRFLEPPEIGQARAPFNHRRSLVPVWTRRRWRKADPGRRCR